MTAGTATPEITADEAHWLRPGLISDYHSALEVLVRHVETLELTPAELDAVREAQAMVDEHDRLVETIGWTDAGFDPDVWITNEMLNADQVSALAVRRRRDLVEWINDEKEGNPAEQIRGLAIVQGLIDRLGSAEAGR